MKILVAGGGGFIGGHLVSRLLSQTPSQVKAVDIQPFSLWHQIFPQVENQSLDLRNPDACMEAVEGCDWVFNLACNMGGMGFIENNKAECMLSVLINTHLLRACLNHRVDRYLFSSSACVYAAEKQTTPNNPGLKEDDAYPASPEDGYGWEKLFSERMCRHFTEDFALATRVARFHNVYGPFGTWDGGREKVPAALCRKVIKAKINDVPDIEIWGDGKQTRSFLYIDDAIDGLMHLMESDCPDPLNIGSDEMVTIDELLSMVEEIAGISLNRLYNLNAPKGVRGRSSDNSLVKRALGWSPRWSLRNGLKPTYDWIHEEIVKAKAEDTKR